jgi:hypothetical protein
MQIGQMRCGAAAELGAGVSPNMRSMDASRRGSGQGRRSIGTVSTNPIGSGWFDPEAIDLLQAALDEAWASLPASRRPYTSREDVARWVLESVTRGERDRTLPLGGG